MRKNGFEFDGVVRLTRTGAAYLLFTVLLGFAALNTGNNSIYIGLVFMLAGLILSGVASKGGLRNVEVKLELRGEVWAGRETSVVFNVANGSRLWNVRDLVITAPDLREPILLPLVPRREAITARAVLVMARRGRASFDEAALYTRYPFGLFAKRRSIAPGGESIVYPRLLPDEEMIKAISAGRAGSLPTNRIGAGTEVFAFREYVRGDSLRLVHWKKSASIGRWIMKQPELEAGKTIRVAFDPVIPAGRTRDDFERLVSSATTLIHRELANGAQIELHLPHRMLSASSGRGRTAIFEALALVEPSFESPSHLYDRGTMLFSLRREHEALIA